MDYAYLLPLGAAVSAAATGLVWYRFLRNPFAKLNGTPLFALIRALKTHIELYSQRAILERLHNEALCATSF